MLFVRLPKVTRPEIVALKELNKTPLEYVLSEEAPVINTVYGEVQLGSTLSYQVLNEYINTLALLCPYCFIFVAFNTLKQFNKRAY